MATHVFSLEGKVLKLDTAEDLEKHIKELRDDADVEEIRFAGNTLGVGASEALAEVLATKKKLQVANLADIFTGRLLSEIPPALDALLKSLLNLPALHTINLSDNAFGLNTVAPLVSFLSAHTPLQHLHLTNNGLGPAAGALVADALADLAAKKKKKRGADAPPLQTVICGRNRLENGSMAAWARAFEAHDGVREVRMPQNGIRQEGITCLLRAGLRHARGLRVLDLQDNTFTAAGARTLGDVVGEWAELRELGVGDCLLGARGSVALGEALARGKNGALEVLRLQYNELDAKGLKALADAQGALPKLRRVELNGNRFAEEDECLVLIREALDERKKKSGSGDEEGEDDEWGIDDLDELEEEEEEEEVEAEVEVEEEEEEVRVEKEVERIKLAEEDNVPLEKDKEVDQLADMLSKTEF